jgi:hypothetical protein
MKHLERLVSWHQLLCYPSEYAGFKRAYESAVAQFSGGTAVQELYIAQLATASSVPRREEHPQFSFVPAELISSDGPFFPHGHLWDGPGHTLGSVTRDIRRYAARPSRTDWRVWSC